MNASCWPQFWLDVRRTVTRMRNHGYPQSAARWFDAVEATVAQVLEQPGRGHPKPRLRPAGLRVLAVRDFPNFLIYYRPLPERVEFLRVAHGRQEAAKLLEQAAKRP